MRQPFRHRFLTALLALAMTAGAHAQSTTRSDGTVEVPVWNQASGKVEAILLLEPTSESFGVRKQFSEGAIEAAFGLGDGDSLGLLCDRKSGVGAAITNLRVAAAHSGYETSVLYQLNDDPLALVTLRETCNPEPELLRLFPAIESRRTSRDDFDGRALEPGAGAPPS